MIQARQRINVDRVGFEPTTSAMPMPYPTGLDDRPSTPSDSLLAINTFNVLGVEVRIIAGHI